MEYMQDAWFKHNMSTIKELITGTCDIPFTSCAVNEEWVVTDHMQALETTSPKFHTM